jgi:threonine synthase
MRFLSTGGNAGAASLEEALQNPLAPDGGLYLPDALPRLDAPAIAERARLDPEALAAGRNLPDVASAILAPFFEGSTLADALPQIAREALDIPAPVLPLGTHDDASVLELYHGPTAAFKDFGARFLAGCLGAGVGHSRPVPELDISDIPARTILCATSGDTGGAVAAAFHGRARTRVVVLYPAGGVSPRQERQLACWGGNVSALRVRGSFDDCQRLVKSAFADPRLGRTHGLASANSINLGRLLPQMSYYAAASLAHERAKGGRASFIVPTGNLGNALACVWTRAMGLPIDSIVLATNANRTIADFLATGAWEPRASIATLASAMDVGDPSNMARLLALAGDADGVRRAVRAQSVDDAAIREEIAATWRESGRIACPHTATALHVLRTMPAEERAGRDWIVVATAHPAKFERIVEPVIGRAVEVPAPLAALLDRPAHAEDMEPTLDALAAFLRRRGVEQTP